MTDVLGHGKQLNDRQIMNLNALALQSDLRDRVRGEVRFDAGTRAIYAHDSSNYRQVPFGVIPKDADDVVAAVEVCHKHGAPVLPRGCGTSLSGETTNVAVIIDTSKYMREILEINAEEGYAWVQPGVVRDDLSNRTESEYNLTFAPDTSTHGWATFRGMIGNNSCGVHSVMAGRTSDNVYELDIVLQDGTRMTVGCHTEEEAERIIQQGGRKGEIYRQLRDLRDRHADEIRSRYVDIPRRVSGYNLDELLPEKGFNVARAIVGTEGTVATVLGAKVRLVHSPPSRSLLILGYSSVYEAGDHVSEILEYGPVGLEGIDTNLIRDMKMQDMHPSDLKLLPEGGGWLLVEFGGENDQESHDNAQKLMDALRDRDDAPDMQLFDEIDEAERIWGIREDGLGATAYGPGEGDHWPGWEDSAVHPDKVGDYLRDLRDLFDKYDYDAALYGHFGDGCIHCCISFDLKSAEGLKDWHDFMEEAADLVVGYGGSLSGEHGDGQQRAEFLPKMYGEDLMQAFREFKRIWDPDWKMNPGKVVDPNPMLSDLRLGADYNPRIPDKLYFSYPEDDGSFAHATMRCVGVGKCRDVDSGTMCPSYMVTFNNYLHPETTKAAVEVLEHGGYRVIVPQQPLCCGRPLFDYGMLETAQVFFDRLVKALAPYVREGIKVVGVEPSCVAAFRDELPNMMPHDEDARRLTRNTLTLSEFLVEEDYEPPKLERKAIVHGHCHQEATVGLSAEQQLYEKMGLGYEVLDSGCCGLAGSWGFEEDKYDLSMQIGERRLLPAARDAEADTIILADGFSCKTQVAQGTDRRALHTAQVIKMALDHGTGGTPRGENPETRYPDVTLDGPSPDLKTVAVAAAAVVGALAWGLARKAT